MKPENSDPTFHFDFRGEVPMKGKPRPIQMWLLSRKPIEKSELIKTKSAIEPMKCPFSSLTKQISEF